MMLLTRESIWLFQAGLRPLLVSVSAMLFTLAFVEGLLAQPISFTKVADTNTQMPEQATNFSLFRPPAIDQGAVAFFGCGGTLPACSAGEGIFFASGGTLQLVVATYAGPLAPGGLGERFDNIASGLSLSGQTVAFQAYANVSGGPDVEGIYSWSGGLLTVIADRTTTVPGASETFVFFDEPCIQGADVVFRGRTPFGPHEGIYLSNSGVLEVVADLTSVAPGGGTFESFSTGATKRPRLGTGKVAFHASTTSTGVGLFTASTANGSFTEIASENTTMPGTSEPFSGFNTFSFDQAVIAFQGRQANPLFEGIYMNITNIGPDLLVVIDGSTGIPGVAGNFRPGVPSVDDGKVAFLTDNTAVPATYTGIYFKDGPFLSKVIGTNDTLDGKQVSDLDFGPEGLSGDQIAFQAHFSDGSTGIFIANLEPGFSSTNPILPIDVPEGCDACPNLPSRNACLACLTNNRPCFEFCVVPNSTWVDPPMAAGFEYRMTSDSLFTAVVDFPTGFDALIVSVDGQPLPGTYGEGDSVDFGDGVQVFSILGISPLVDATQPDVFPVKLAFSTDTASFTMRPLICPPSPTPGCEEGWEKTRLLIKESSPGKEKLVAKFLGGPELSQGDFGTPLVPDGAEYSLCLYTGTGSLAGEVSVIGSGAVCGEKECWKAIGGYPPDGKGLKYADTAASSDGVRLFKLLGGQLGKSRILIKAKNNANKDQLMMPTGIAKSLSTTESVTMQLVRSDTGACFSSNLSDLRRQEADLFKAK